MDSREGKVFEYIVSSHEAALRLDIYLSQKDLGLSRSQIKKYVDDKLVLVNHTNAKVGCRLKQGDHVQISMREPVIYHVLPEDILVPHNHRPAGY